MSGGEQLARQADNCFYPVLIGAVNGARLWYDLFNLDLYGRTPSLFVAPRLGDFAWPSALLCGLLAGYLWCRWNQFDELQLADSAALGSVGLLLSGEAFGVPTNLPWGVSLFGATRPRADLPRTGGADQLRSAAVVGAAATADWWASSGVPGLAGAHTPADRGATRRLAAASWRHSRRASVRAGTAALRTVLGTAGRAKGRHARANDGRRARGTSSLSNRRRTPAISILSTFCSWSCGTAIAAPGAAVMV